MGTFREMAVSGQTSSHQDGKWSEEKCVCVHVCVFLNDQTNRGSAKNPLLLATIP